MRFTRLSNTSHNLAISSVEHQTDESPGHLADEMNVREKVAMIKNEKK